MSSERSAAVDYGCAGTALAGALILYRGWRGGLWLHRWATSFDEALARFAHAHPLPDWARYSLPDALWQYAFVVTMLAVWRGEPWSRTKVAFVTAPVVFGMLVELGQGLGVVSGTFDLKDLLGSLAAAILGVVLHGRTTVGRERRACPCPT
jgi:hypothetical protein